MKTPMVMRTSPSKPRWRPRLLCIATLAALALAPVATVWAAPKHPPTYDPAQEKIARGHFDRAEKAFNLRKFDEALAAYQAAYEALPLPAFLFNIAQCHRNLHDREQAIFFYQRYLSLEPDAPNRQVVEGLIAEQKEQLSAAPSDSPSAPVDLNVRPEPATPVVAQLGTTKSAPPRKDTWKTTRWWLAGGLAAGLVGAVAFFALRPAPPQPSGSLGILIAH